ncbi:MAG: 23S rRNA (pseudouridine(1915)-N(3))-methyltransferase RlmH [Methanomicrobiales archaeon]|nr:23S rRNA (pseudouridine(1915)-N(3))-methyltransferase RlmH [Methanomicrobiales archaeon]
MQIHIIAVGRIKERYLQDGIEEYAKRLRSYTTLRMVEIPDEKVPPRAKEPQKEKVRETEGAHLLGAAPAGAWMVALHPEGVELSSDAFADKISAWQVEGPHNVAFLIGGELGLSAPVLATTDFQLSLSQMTFPHQMVRLILIEALYRAFRQIRGEPYHR